MLADVAIFFLLCASIKCTIVRAPESIGDTFRQCLMSYTPDNFGRCLGASAITKLQSLDSSPEFDFVDGVTLTRSGQETRELNFVDGDPTSFRTIMDSFNQVFSTRNLRWNMGFLYPGLAMRLAPSGGTLEFVLDTHREATNMHSLKEVGTGRLLARQFLLPFLLGFKFNVASLLPIIFGLLALLAKKALIVSKVALIVTSSIALACILFGQGGNRYPQYYAPQQFQQGYGYHPYKQYADEDYQDPYYKNIQENGSDKLHLYNNVGDLVDRTLRESKIKGRNFAWSVEDKKAEEKVS